MFRKYEEWACGILTRCQENPGKCKPADLVLRVVPNWGYATCLTLAESAENLKFLSHTVVTDLLADKWHGLLIGSNLIPSGYFGRLLATTVVKPIYSYLILKKMKEDVILKLLFCNSVQTIRKYYIMQYLERN